MSTLSAAASIAGQYNLSDYVPPEIQSDIATGETIYNAASKVQGNVTIGPHGTIALSDSAQQAIGDTIVGAISVVAPALGAAFEIFMALAPKAGPGPGVCATDPPVSSSPSSLVAWPYFTSWQSFFGPYPTYPVGSFEAFANPILEFNWLLAENCFSSSPHYVSPPILLGLLINAWNAKHDASVRRTVTRTGLNPPGFSPEASNYDPIANALEVDAIAKATAAVNSQAGVTFEQSIAATEAVPNYLTSSFVINDGPLIVHVIDLQLRPGNPTVAATMAPAPGGSSAAPSTGKRVLVGGLIVVGVGAAGVGAWALATHQSYLGALRGVWRSSGGKVVSKIRKINPLPVAMETFGEASKKTNVQTLLFPRPRYSESRAKAWAHAHGYGVHKAPDVTANYIRIRQKPPSDFEKNSFRTISLGKSGVRAVVGHLR